MMKARRKDALRGACARVGCSTVSAIRYGHDVMRGSLQRRHRSGSLAQPSAHPSMTSPLPDPAELAASSVVDSSGDRRRCSFFLRYRRCKSFTRYLVGQPVAVGEIFAASPLLAHQHGVRFWPRLNDCEIFNCTRQFTVPSISKNRAQAISFVLAHPNLASGRWYMMRSPSYLAIFYREGDRPKRPLKDGYHPWSS